MQLIPPTLTDLASSKKAVTFWVIIALWTPVVRDTLGLDQTALIWLTIAFCAYALAQGIADCGEALAKK